MESVSREGTLLDAAIRRAGEIAAAYPPSARYQLLTSDFESVHQRLLTREEFTEELQRVKISPSTRLLSEVTARQSDALKNSRTTSAESFLLSDFQKTTSDFNNIRKDSLLKLNVVALPVQSVSNLLIDSCWIESPVVQINRPVELKVRLRNSGEQDSENVPVKLLINNTQRAVATVPVRAGNTAETTMTFTLNAGGWQRCEIQITDHPITFDDTYYLSFEVREKLNVLDITGNTPGPYLPSLFGNDPFFNYSKVSASNVNYSALGSNDLIVLSHLPEVSSGLSAELNKYLRSGGSVVVFPDSNANLVSYNSFIADDLLSEAVTGNDKVSEVDIQHPVFSDVFEKKNNREQNIDYPSVFKHYPLGRGGSGRIVLMKLQGGDPLLAEYRKDKGKLYLFTVPLFSGYSNLARHAMIVPVLYKISLLSINQPSFSYMLGREVPVETNAVMTGTEETFHMRNEELKTDFIPAVRNTASGVQVFPSGQIRHAGLYELTSSTGLIAVLAYNYDRRESVMQFYNESGLPAALSEAGLANAQVYKAAEPDFTKTINRAAEGISLWKYCIILTLVFLLAETLLLRFWKTAS